MPRHQLAVIEVAGLAQIDPAERNPWAAASRGVGELIQSALDRGATAFIIGLGGSATNDAVAGMLAALGARVLDRDGNPVPEGARGSTSLESLDLSSFVGGAIW